MKIPKNWVLIKPIPLSNEKLVGDKKLILSSFSGYDQPQETQRWGTIVGVPQKLTFPELEFKGEIEIKEGDEVLFDYLIAMSRMNTMHDVAEPTCNLAGEGTVFLSYNDLFLKRNGNKLIPLNGYILIEPIFDDIKTTVELPNHLKKEKKTNKGKVLKVGSLVEYREKEAYCEDTDELKEGDIVLMRPGSDVYLEDSLFSTIGNIIAVQRKRILCLIEDI